MHLVGVRHIHETFFEEARRAVRDHAVTLHLTEAKTSVARSALSRLPSQDLRRASAARVHLVSDHVLETLVEGWAQEDHYLKFLASEAIVHHFIAVALESELVELRANELNILVLERRGITFIAIETGNF